MKTQSSKLLLLVVILCFPLIVYSQTAATALTVETYAGTMSSSGSTNGDRLSAKFNEPIDMVFDASGISMWQRKEVRQLGKLM